MNGADDDIYVMTNAYWEEPQFRIQEGTPQDWVRIVDTSLLTPDDFAELGVPLKACDIPPLHARNFGSLRQG